MDTYDIGDRTGANLVSEQNKHNGEQRKPRNTEFLNLPSDNKPMPQRAPSGNTSILGQGWRVVFNIGEQKHALVVQERVLIGRGIEGEVDTQGIDFDLTPFGAYHFGVSRHHAVLTFMDGYLYIEDLGSTNGTRINGFQLSANQKYRLRDDDEVEFARLRTSIRFKSPDES